MITDLRNQDSDTILDLLARKGRMRRYFSSRIDGLNERFTNHNIYIYATRREMVFVFIDTEAGNRREIAYDQRIAGNAEVQYISYSLNGALRRTSPVWRMLQATQAYRDLFMSKPNAPRIWHILLTSSCIANKPVLSRTWQEMGVTVYDNMKNLDHLSLPVNEGWDMPMSHKAKDFLDVTDSSCSGLCVSEVFLPLLHLRQVKEMLDEDAEAEGSQLEGQSNQDAALPEPPADFGNDIFDDDFERQLQEFINSEDSEGWADTSGILDHDDEDCTDADDEDEDEDEDEDDNTPSSFESIWGVSSKDTDLPDGELQLSPSNTIKVEILKPVDNPREELDRLVGCREIKQRIDQLISLSRYNKLMRTFFPNAKQHKLSLHGIFTGRPGTGKTTVCKIYGSLLHEAGVLSKGHVVVTSRSTYLGTNWGDEERVVREVVDMAQGGVLMIDEAYLLNSDNKNDPGKMVIPLLMDILANEDQRDIAIILCGYKEKMDQLLELNTGLTSRFPNRFDFPDFTIDELLEITRRRIKEYNYRFTPAAWTKYRQLVGEAYGVRDAQTWGNARFVANLLERIYVNHACRCMDTHRVKPEQFLQLTPSDVQPIEVPKQRRHIGF